MNETMNNPSPSNAAEKLKSQEYLASIIDRHCGVKDLCKQLRTLLKIRTGTVGDVPLNEIHGWREMFDKAQETLNQYEG